MRQIIDYDGFKKATKAGKKWTMLSCDLTETEPDRWYWEIEKHVFFEKEGRCERLAEGEDGDDLTNVKKIWENLIEKYQPDEYFVDQDSTD